MPRSVVNPCAKKSIIYLQVTALLLLPVNSAMADGLTGGVVVDGAAAINATGGVTTITQSTQNAIINWNSFSIGASEAANFVQPNINAAVLNRVTGGNLSTIAGQLNANGQVYLVNPTGVVFANGSLIDVGGITASTLDISNNDFMNGGTNTFSGTSNASIINNGRITANSGNINLFAADVQNNGTLNAPNGLVNLGGGHNITQHADGTYSVNGANGSVQVLNSGAISGGRTVLTAGAGVTAVNSGVEKATLIVRHEGRIRLGNAESVIEMAGGSTIGSTAGHAPAVTLNGSTTEIVAAEIDATSSTGGGVVEVGGSSIDHVTADTTTVSNSTIDVSATEAGDGGDIIVWSNDRTSITGSTLRAEGGILGGDGGLIETSGKNAVGVSGNTISASAPIGMGGLWLVDPVDAVVANLGGSGQPPFAPPLIDADDISATLTANTSVMITTAGIGSDDGNVLFFDPDIAGGPVTISAAPTSPVTLSFHADNDIFGGSVVGGGPIVIESLGAPLSVLLNADADNSLAGSIYLTDLTVNTRGGSIVMYGIGDALDSSVTIGGAPVSMSYTSGDTPLLIPEDGSTSGTTTSTITVPDSFTITDVDVEVDVNHSFAGDLEIGVTSPTATTVELVDNTGGGRDPGGAYLFADGGSGTFPDDLSPIEIAPLGSLADFNGQDSAGNWSLDIEDTVMGDSGTLNSWTLFLAGSGDQTIDSPADGTGVTLIDSVLDAGTGSIQIVGLGDTGVAGGSEPGTLIYSSTDTPLRIPEGTNSFGSTTSTITVPDSFSITDVDVEVDVNHSFAADLDIGVTSPSTTTVALVEDEGGGDNPAGAYLFADGGTGSFPYDLSPVEINPLGSLANFNGETSSGTWTLGIIDDTGGDIGELNSWTLFLTGNNALGTPTGIGVDLRNVDVNAGGLTPTQDFSAFHSQLTPISGLSIDGTGGGIAASLIRPIVADSPDAFTAISNVLDHMGNGNMGVRISESGLNTGAGDLVVQGLGGTGHSDNDGVHISDTPVNSTGGNINIIGYGGGLDAEAIQDRGPSWILEDSDGMVNTLFEQAWDEPAVALFATIFGSENDGVFMQGARNVSVTSDYIEPANIRDINNNFLTGGTVHVNGLVNGYVYTADKAAERDDLNLNGTRHPDARHLLIDGQGGIGHSHRGVNIESSGNLNITTESADLHVRGNGGGMADAYMRGLIETTMDVSPFDGSDRVANTGLISNNALITAISELYGDGNTGVQLRAFRTVNIQTFSNRPDGGASRTVRAVGGNIFLEGVGGPGQSDNVGIAVLSRNQAINILSDVGNISIDGTGGGPSTNVFAIEHPGNGRVDRLLEVDLSTDDLNDLVMLFADSFDNEGIRMRSPGAISIRSGFEEPPALRQFSDGTFGYGFVNPNDASDRGTLVMVAAADAGSHLIVDANGALLPVVNNAAFNLNDNGIPGADIATSGVAVVQTRTVDIIGRGGRGSAGHDGVFMETAFNINIGSFAATLNIAGQGGGIDSLLTRSLIENAADGSVGSTDRIDSVDGATTISDLINAQDIIATLDGIYAESNDGLDLNADNNVNIITELTPTKIWRSDVLQPLGPDGREMVDLSAWGLGTMRLDMLPSVDISGLTAAEQEAVRAEIAKVSDTLIVTATRERADINIIGAGGAGDSDNVGIYIDASNNVTIATRNEPAPISDGGNINLLGVGGGIPSGAEAGVMLPPNSAFQLLQNVVQVDDDGIVNTLLEVNLEMADLRRFARDVYGSDNDGMLIQSGNNTSIESEFVEPFVPTAPFGTDWGGPVHLNGNDLLVAHRHINLLGQGGSGIHENKGVNLNASNQLNVLSESANIRVHGIAGGVLTAVGQHLIANGVNGDIGNHAIINALSDLYGDDNIGVELEGRVIRVQARDDRVSAPNSLVGAVAVIGTGGNGSYGNIGVDIHAGVRVAVGSLVGNVAIVGNAGGFPTLVVHDDSAAVDSISELPDLGPAHINRLRPGQSTGDVYGDENHGIHVRSPLNRISAFFDEPNIEDPDVRALHAYSYRNGLNKRNPFFLGPGEVDKRTPKTNESGDFVRVNRLDIPEIMAGQAGAGSDGRTDGRELVVAGRGGTGQSNNKGVFLQGGDSHIESVDADVDVDGLGGGIPDAVVAALAMGHIGPGFDSRISQLYGVVNHGVQIIGAGSGVQIYDEGNMEVNGTGGQGYAANKGILILGGNIYSAETGNIIMVGTGGGILETFNERYDAAARNPGLREANHGIQIGGASFIQSYFDVQNRDNPYEMKMEGLLLLDGLVGNNAGLGNDEVGETRDITDESYEHDLGGPITDDAGVLIHGGSMVLSADADIDIFANLDLLVRNGSMVLTSEDGDISAVATRHVEVSGSSFINSSGQKENGDPTLTTVAWDQSRIPSDPFLDNMGRLKVQAGSGIGASMGRGELRLYGQRRGTEPQSFGFNANGETEDTAGYPLRISAYNNEIDGGALFNGVPWLSAEDAPEPGIDSGNHNEEFCTWEQEQWGVTFDIANRRAVTDSDRFATTQAPTAYNFGNPQSTFDYNTVVAGPSPYGYTDSFVFYYPGLNLHSTLPLPNQKQLLPFIDIRENLGPLPFEQMIESVFPGPGPFIAYGDGWNGANGGTLGDGFTIFGSTPVNVSSPNSGPVRFDNLQSLIEFFEDEPAGTYMLGGNGNDETTKTPYVHDPDDEDWKEKLLDALEAADEGAPPVPAVPATAELETDIKISGITR